MVRRNRQLCVKIARDVIAQLRLKRYGAEQGVYVSINASLIDVAGDTSFKTFFKKNKKTTCSVCALGAAFVSLVNIENKCSVDDMCAEKDLFERLEQHFGADNMCMMESAFENEILRNVDSCDMSNEMLDAACNWGYQYQDPNLRLRAIMLNVIRNNGDFKLPQKYLRSAKQAEQERLAETTILR